MPNVLVASDDRSIAGLIALNLEKRGYSTVTCEVQGEGLASKVAGTFDLAVIDLPQDDLEVVAVALARVLKAPLIILCEASLSRARLAQLGGAAYIRKPFDMDRLLDAVRVILARADWKPDIFERSSGEHWKDRPEK
ncbi:MAG: response regulator transcription factor [Chloroflexi bacterium]|nr:response regulator transcription factor [Chloroflexota bacterium]